MVALVATEPRIISLDIQITSAFGSHGQTGDAKGANAVCVDVLCSSPSSCVFFWRSCFDRLIISVFFPSSRRGLPQTNIHLTEKACSGRAPSGRTRQKKQISTNYLYSLLHSYVSLGLWLSNNYRKHTFSFADSPAPALGTHSLRTKRSIFPSYVRPLWIAMPQKNESNICVS